MATFSPIPGYTLGTAFTGLGLVGLFLPRTAYETFGLPLELLPGQQGISPMLYAKGVRDLCFGITYLVLQYKGMNEAVTVLSQALCLVALGDGLIVWTYGGRKLKVKAFGHWFGILGLGFWSTWRM
ncbi:unnamed protein product [Clonostachys solani]|uniref:Uncharacterized protein n=1 Tax=Clonostachys solani TaxID=160281 RepID=A0A9P0ELW3_9HYPO|nr:unnamed protein product [Clonostachys solani]